MNGEQTQRAAFEAHFGDCFDNIEPGLRAVARVWAWQGWLAAQTQRAPECRRYMDDYPGVRAECELTIEK